MLADHDSHANLLETTYTQTNRSIPLLQSRWEDCLLLQRLGPTQQRLDFVQKDSEAECSKTSCQPDPCCSPLQIRLTNNQKIPKLLQTQKSDVITRFPITETKPSQRRSNHHYKARPKCLQTPNKYHRTTQITYQI